MAPRSRCLGSVLLLLLSLTLGAGAGDGREEGVRVIWMMQGKKAMDLSFLRSPASDAIQGRNYLLQKAVALSAETGVVYEYYIYTEDDAELEEILDFGLNT
ncbi:hypothetical protein T484DRAFT_1806289, partial [Baffinella frigidus]